MKEEPADGSPYFGRFPSDRMPKTTNDAKVHLFIHSYFTTGIISANFRNILKLLRLVIQFTVEQLVVLTLHRQKTYYYCYCYLSKSQHFIQSSDAHCYVAADVITTRNGRGRRSEMMSRQRSGKIVSCSI